MAPAGFLLTWLNVQTSSLRPLFVEALTASMKTLPSRPNHVSQPSLHLDTWLDFNILIYRETNVRPQQMSHPSSVVKCKESNLTRSCISICCLSWTWQLLFHLRIGPFIATFAKSLKFLTRCTHKKTLCASLFSLIRENWKRKKHLMVENNV